MKLPVLYRLFAVGSLWLCHVLPGADTMGFFQSPEAPYLTAPDEEIYAVAFAAGPVGELQALLDDARERHPDSFLVLRVEGVLTVTDAPLRLGSRTALVFLTGGGVRAADDATADALLSIVDAETVSLSTHGIDRALLDGRDLVADGIVVRNASRVHVDRLRIQRCVRNGIDYSGRGDDVRPVSNDWWRRKYAPEFSGRSGSITRCRLEDNGRNGVRVSAVPQFMAVDNVLVKNAAAGIDIRSFNSVVAGSVLQGNAVGVVQRSTDGVVVSNILRRNRTGVTIADIADLNLFTYNRLVGNDLGYDLEGKRNSIYHNELRNLTEFRVSGVGNTIAGHRELAGGQVGAEGNLYFNPPTAANFHRDPVVVNGLGRVDIEIEGGPGRLFTPFPPDEALDLAAVQQTLDEARAAHPDTVIVARLRGRFLATGEGSALRLPDNTCVVLQGVILAQGDGLEEIVRMDGKGVVSFSGGLLDADYQAADGIRVTGRNTAIIDGVTLKHAAGNAINTKEHGGPGSPVFIRGCTVTNSRGRGIWAHVTADAHVIDNVSSGNRSDGVDLDAFCFHSTALLNVCTANARSGVFVEEGINSTVVFGNVFNRNHTGILVYNHSVEGNTGANVMACNEVRENTHFGVSIRGMRFPNKTAHGNLVFGNVIAGNQAAGVRFGHPAARDNVVTQNVLRANATEVDYIMQQPVQGFFSAPAAARGDE